MKTATPPTVPGIYLATLKTGGTVAATVAAFTYGPGENYPPGLYCTGYTCEAAHVRHGTPRGIPMGDIFSDWRLVHSDHEEAAAQSADQLAAIAGRKAAEALDAYAAALDHADDVADSNNQPDTVEARLRREGIRKTALRRFPRHHDRMTSTPSTLETAALRINQDHAAAMRERADQDDTAAADSRLFEFARGLRNDVSEEDLAIGSPAAVAAASARLD